MYLIVGLDPGTSVGISILNFKGEIIDVFSSKHMSVENVIKHINEFGKASIIASDVDHIPNFVYKVATAFDAKIYIPERNLSVEEKVFLTRNVKYKDTHQRDSLSAAIYAYKNYKNMFDKVESLGYGDDVKFYVIKGYSISEAIAKVEPKVVAIPSIISEEENEGENVKIDPKKFSELKENVRILEKSRQILREQIIEKDKEIERLKEKIREMEREKRLSEIHPEHKDTLTIRALEISLETLKKDISLMQNKLNEFYEIYRKIGMGEIIPVGVYPEIFNGLTYVKKDVKINKDDMELFSKVEIAYVEKNLNLPCITVDATSLKNFDNVLFYVEKEELKKIRESWSIEEIIKKYRESRKRK